MNETPMSMNLAAGGRPDDCGVVIFGASGDLTRRKLLPALYNLFLDGLLPDHFAIIGFARTKLTNEEFREQARQAIEKFSRRKFIETERWSDFEKRLVYHPGSYDNLESFQGLRKLQESVCDEFKTCGNWLYYLSTPPSTYEDVARCLSVAGLAGKGSKGKPWSRLVIEKPIGNDLDSARNLNDALSQACDESQTFRIDHYLGKETVQNIMVLRFANGIFEPLWNHNYIDHVQITVAESDGVGDRGGYYEQSGALRDMLQNHILQLLCLIAMDPPHNLGADSIRDKKLEVLQAIRPLSLEDIRENVVRGQYDAGLLDSEPVNSYRDSVNVPDDSSRETFVALRLLLDNWRWSGVPFYVRTGKRLPRRNAEISVQFKSVPPILFNANPSRPLNPNVLTIRLQPNEGISLQIDSKKPGLRVDINPVKLDFGYSSVYPAGTSEAYERLLLDVMLGDSTLFMRRDEVEAAWAFVTPILLAWEEMPAEDFPNYVAGSSGPSKADEILARDGRRWRKV